MNGLRSVIELMMDLGDQKREFRFQPFPDVPSDLHCKKVTGNDLGNLRQHSGKTGSANVV
jgi:hypothetical protein